MEFKELNNMDRGCPMPIGNVGKDIQRWPEGRIEDRGQDHRQQTH